jgi:hypothetical protein
LRYYSLSEGHQANRNRAAAWQDFGLAKANGEPSG